MNFSNESDYYIPITEEEKNSTLIFCCLVRNSQFLVTSYLEWLGFTHALEAA